jgi:hypothetical protein
MPVGHRRVKRCGHGLDDWEHLFGEQPKTLLAHVKRHAPEAPSADHDLLDTGESLDAMDLLDDLIRCADELGLAEAARRFVAAGRTGDRGELGGVALIAFHALEAGRVAAAIVETPMPGPARSR